MRQVWLRCSDGNLVINTESLPSLMPALSEFRRGDTFCGHGILTCSNCGTPVSGLRQYNLSPSLTLSSPVTPSQIPGQWIVLHTLHNTISERRPLLSSSKSKQKQIDLKKKKYPGVYNWISLSIESRRKKIILFLFVWLVGWTFCCFYICSPHRFGNWMPQLGRERIPSSKTFGKMSHKNVYILCSSNP